MQTLFQPLCLFSFSFLYCTGVTYSKITMKVGRVGILVFFMILRGKHWVVTIKDCVKNCLLFGFESPSPSISLDLLKDYLFVCLFTMNEKIKCKLRCQYSLSPAPCSDWLAGLLDRKRGSWGSDRKQYKDLIPACWSFERKSWKVYKIAQLLWKATWWLHMKLNICLYSDPMIPLCASIQEK